jgi:manganese/zinc/iron transport system permease protein
MLNEEAFLIITAGSLVAITCSILGCFLVLRKMAMVSDAISHAVLPGIVIAFLLAGTRESVSMLIGAGLIGMFCTFLIEFLHRKVKLQSDASIGITFTWLFALGVILISYFAGQTDLDQECVLYGELAYVPLEPYVYLMGTPVGTRTILTMAVVLVLVIVFVIAGYKELYLTTFDGAYALSIGIAATAWHYLLMGAVSLTTVAAFESVGAVLVVAFLIVPAATAYLLTENFIKMVLLSCFLGITAVIGGYYLAVAIDGAIAAAMATVAGIQFALAFAWYRFAITRNTSFTLEKGNPVINPVQASAEPQPASTHS